MPSGILNPNAKCIIGNGCVIHFPTLKKELEHLEANGVVWKGRLMISDRAHIVFDFHQTIDGRSEQELGTEKIGTTGKGIGPTYCEKANRSGIRVGDLKHFKLDDFKQKLNKIVASARKRFNFEYDIESELKRYEEYSKIFGDCILDGVWWLNDQYKQGKKILVEGANAAMLDLDFGTYPFVTSSNPTIGGCLTGLGLSHQKLGDVIGVVKAYTTRVGAGPFPTELYNEIGQTIRKTGGEFGTTTGRPRRCGWLDIPVLQFSCMLNGYTSLNLTKLDILTGFDEVKIGIAYLHDGKRLPSVPSSLEVLSSITVEYETLPGWKEDISKCTKFSELPVNAQNYIKRVAQLVETPVKWVGVGAAREALIEL